MLWFFAGLVSLVLALLVSCWKGGMLQVVRQNNKTS